MKRIACGVSSERHTSACTCSTIVIKGDVNWWQSEVKSKTRVARSPGMLSLFLFCSLLPNVCAKSLRLPNVSEIPYLAWFCVSNIDINSWRGFQYNSELVTRKRNAPFWHKYFKNIFLCRLKFYLIFDHIILDFLIYYLVKCVKKCCIFLWFLYNLQVCIL